VSVMLVLAEHEARAMFATCELGRIAFERLEITAPEGEDHLAAGVAKLADALRAVDAHDLVSSCGNDFELDKWDPRRASSQAFPGDTQ
jgi:hypothetical protein